jgi:hypothetical protein
MRPTATEPPGYRKSRRLASPLWYRFGVKILALFALFLQVSTPNYLYPVRVQLLTSDHHLLGAVSSGVGNIYDLNLGERGFDYSAAGCGDLQPNLGADRYAGRWVKETQLVLKTQLRGGRTVECTMQVTIHDYIWIVGSDGKVYREDHPNSHQ